VHGCGLTPQSRGRLAASRKPPLTSNVRHLWKHVDGYPRSRSDLWSCSSAVGVRWSLHLLPCQVMALPTKVVNRIICCRSPLCSSPCSYWPRCGSFSLRVLDESQRNRCLSGSGGHRSPHMASQLPFSLLGREENRKVADAEAESQRCLTGCST
jgi:hypothetical protein